MLPIIPIAYALIGCAAAMGLIYIVGIFAVTLIGGTGMAITFYKKKWSGFLISLAVFVGSLLLIAGHYHWL